MGRFSEISPAVAEVKDLFSWERRSFERKFFILVDPVSWDGDRRNVSIVGESVDLADYEVLWDGGNPDSARALDGGVVWVRWAGNTNTVNDIRFRIGKRQCLLRCGYGLGLPSTNATHMPPHPGTYVSSKRPVSLPVFVQPDLRRNCEQSWDMVRH